MPDEQTKTLLCTDCGFNIPTVIGLPIAHLCNPKPPLSTSRGAEGGASTSSSLGEDYLSHANLVFRLRTAAMCAPSDAASKLHERAADEIERLRADNERLQNLGQVALDLHKREFKHGPI